jgi:hypothetical protein
MPTAIGVDGCFAGDRPTGLPNLVAGGSCGAQHQHHNPRQSILTRRYRGHKVYFASAKGLDLKVSR